MRILLLLFVLLLCPAWVYAGDESEPPVATPLETTVVLAGHEGLVRTLAFHPDGGRLASGGPDRTLRVWSLARAAQIAMLRLPRGG